MAEHAFLTARIVPRLFALAARCGGVLDRVGAVQAIRLDEIGIGSRFVPSVRVSDPVVVLLDHDARFDTATCIRVTFLHVETERLNRHRSVVKRPGAVLIEVDPQIARHTKKPLLVSTI